MMYLLKSILCSVLELNKSQNRFLTNDAFEIIKPYSFAAKSN